MTNKPDRTELLRQIRDEIIAFKSSPLYSYRQKNKYFPVIGEGNHYAKIMFIGEAPGKNEAETGRPFCGAAGKILDELIESIELKRKDVYITNILKDRPPANRDPLPAEIKAYAPFLDQQIKIIQPKIIATLGRFSMNYILDKFGLGENVKTITQLHGSVLEVDARYGTIKIVPLYHPAVAVYNASQKDVLKKDFQILKTLL